MSLPFYLSTAFESETDFHVTSINLPQCLNSYNQCEASPPCFSSAIFHNIRITGEWETSIE